MLFTLAFGSFRVIDADRKFFDGLVWLIENFDVL
jgi:hypothetical protein